MGCTVKLIGFYGSPNTRKPLAVAHELGIDLPLEIIDIIKAKDHLKPDYLAINPNGLTPTLVDGDFILWEGNAIAQYLADLKPGNRLWPSSMRTRADIARWQFWQCDHWGKACEAYAVENMLKPMIGESPDAHELARGEQLFHKFAKVLDTHLSRHPFLVEDRFTLADIACGVYMEDAPYSGMPVDAYPYLCAWFARISAEPCMAATKPNLAALGF
jgi:glutathione S-transferase